MQPVVHGCSCSCLLLRDFKDWLQSSCAKKGKKNQTGLDFKTLSIKAGLEGVGVVGGDGNVCRVHLILACYIANYPEQCLVTCSKLGTCLKCLQVALGESSLGKVRTQSDSLSTITQVKRSAQTLREFQLKCRHSLMSGNVTMPFWVGLPFCCIHGFITIGL